MTIDINTLTRDEKSILLYAETCLVDRSGLLCGDRMNDADRAALAKFKAAGVLDYGRIPHKLVKREAVADTHWITFNDEAWAAAHALRRERAKQVCSQRRAINAALAERVAA
jgi:hypothetical protein